jgi:hypothetical protein
MQQLQLKDKQPLKQPLKVQEHRRLPREHQLQEQGEHHLQRREQEHHHESSACCQKYVYAPGFRIRIQEGKMTHKNIKKVQNFHVFMCWMFSFEG